MGAARTIPASDKVIIPLATIIRGYRLMLIMRCTSIAKMDVEAIVHDIRMLIIAVETKVKKLVRGDNIDKPVANERCRARHRSSFRR